MEAFSLSKDMIGIRKKAKEQSFFKLSGDRYRTKEVRG